MNEPETDPMNTRFSNTALMVMSLFCILSWSGCATSPAKPRPDGVYYGKASYYGAAHHGKRTASGDIFDQNKLTCAHRDLPFETICRVTNLANGKTVVVRVNDRGPFIRNRVIDLSYRAMKTLDGIKAGVIDAKIEILK